MASVSYNTTFAFNATIAEVREISWGGSDVTVINTTHLTSANAAKTSLPGFRDDGEVTLKCLYGKTQFAALDALIRTVASFTLTLADGSTLTGSGFMSKTPSIEVSDDDAVQCSITIKITGKVTFTAA